ncbi:MAG: hypothetical protein M1830_009825 [Pleopsidium flavum]|nr:MAG: hypothetical protein M1830_009825 [Pleopsidium flavum]
MGWAFDDKYKMHSELGPVFMHVTPAENELYISDADAISEVLSRRRDFPKPTAMYKMLEIFGKNVDTVEGHEWQRHRRITAPPFNERNSKLVWLESLRQAIDMRDWWVQHGQDGINTVVDDTMILSLHVLTCAGFGMSYHFRSAMEAPKPGYSMTYRDALSTVLENVLIVVALPHKILSLPVLPRRLATVGRAIEQFKMYMIEMLEREKQLITQRAPGTGNLMSSLVRGSEEAQRRLTSSAKTSGESTEGLTDTEILGNVFLYNLAGHETTANTLSYCTLLFAVYPEWQEWVAEEVREVLRGHGSIETWEYEKLFPRMKRCLAIMLETLRLFGPVTAIPKYTNDLEQELTINGKKYTIPRKTIVLPNVTAIHTHPRYWGEDSLLWRPSRWINSSKPDADLKVRLDAEVIREPIKGSYIPWSEGARICPGKKFAQVEFVAVMAALFRDHRVRPVPRKEESLKEVRKRILSVVEDSRLGITLQMQNPKSVALAWSQVGL